MNSEKSKSPGLLIVIAILVITILLLIVYIVSQGNIKKDNRKTNNQESNQPNEITEQKHKAGNLYKNSDSDQVICSTQSDNPYQVGTKYICNNLGDQKVYTFYVLNEDQNSKQVNLIMDRDYATSTYFAKNVDGSVNYNTFNAITTLPTNTIWTNLESPKDSSGYDYSNYAARLPMAAEIATACNITDFNSSNDKIYELKTKQQCSFLWENTQYVDPSYQYNGYLTSTLLPNSYLSWIVDANNITKEDFESHVGVTSGVQMYNTVILRTVSTASFGVRPVISLSK